jgi:hypothetical protein
MNASNIGVPERSFLLEKLYFPSRDLDGSFDLHENFMLDIFVKNHLHHFEKFSPALVITPPGHLDALEENERATNFKVENPNTFDSEKFCRKLCEEYAIPLIFKEGLKRLFFGQLKIQVKTFICGPKTSINAISSQYDPTAIEPLSSLSGRFVGDVDAIASETSLIIAKKTFAIIKETPDYFMNMDFYNMGHPNIGPPGRISELANELIITEREFLVFVENLQGFTISSRTLFNSWLHYVDPVQINDLAGFINEFCIYIGN